jgi:hypothetical protein
MEDDRYIEGITMEGDQYIEGITVEGDQYIEGITVEGDQYIEGITVEDQYMEGITMEELKLPFRETRNRENLGLDKLNTNPTIFKVLDNWISSEYT